MEIFGELCVHYDFEDGRRETVNVHRLSGEDEYVILLSA
jgi:hypothetical protein